jgi:hypothetical protein
MTPVMGSSLKTAARFFAKKYEKFLVVIWRGYLKVIQCSLEVDDSVLATATIRNNVESVIVCCSIDCISGLEVGLYFNKVLQ